MRWSWFAGLGVVGLLALALGLYVQGSGESAPAGQVIVSLPPAAGAPALLLPAPDPALVENSPDGPLPITAKDGRTSWQVYARPFDRGDKRPRLALVVIGLGLDRALSQAVVDRLPGAVTLGFDPYAVGAKDAMIQARSLGHETLIGLPMEPPDYPRQDPGPLTLLASLASDENGARLKKVMAAGVGYVGMVAIMGGRFVAEKTALIPVLEILKQRGVMLVDNRPPVGNGTALLAGQMKLPWAAADRVLDSDTDPATIDQTFADLEAIAQRNGVALGVAALSPALVDHAATWVATLDAKGLALAPVSAVANRQTIQAAATP